MLHEANSSKLKAIRAFTDLKREWGPTDVLLSNFFKAGKLTEVDMASHHSDFNKHLQTLCNSLNMPILDVDAHIRAARSDMSAARQFVASLL